MWKHSMLARATIGNCHFYTNFAVFKTKIWGTIFKLYMRENQTLNMNYMKINNFNIVFHMTWDKW